MEWAWRLRWNSIFGVRCCNFHLIEGCQGVDSQVPHSYKGLSAIFTMWVCG